MTDQLSIPFYSKVFRKVARPVFRMLFHILSRVSISGRANIPADGAYIIAPNHISIYEPPLLAAFWPRELEIAAAIEILDRPIQSEIMRLYHTIHVHRDRMDRSLIRGLLTRLASGSPVLIFPEGTRTMEPGLVQGHTGVAYLAAKAEVGVIPVGIVGTAELWQGIKRFTRPRVEVRIGRMLTFPPLDLRSRERKQALRNRTDEIMTAIAHLLPEDYRGAYA